MQTLPATQVADNFEELCELAYQSQEPYILRRANQHDVVIMSLNDFNSWQETHYLLSNPHNAQRLLSSLEQARSGQAKPRELLEE